MTFDLRDAQARILALNSEELPFIYDPTPDGIVAHWRYADQRWLGFIGAGMFSAEYELRVELHPEDGEWEFHEQSSSSKTTLGVDGLSSKRTWQSGPQKSFSFGRSVAPISQSTDRDGTTTGQFMGYDFTTDEVKQPVIDALTAAGWKARKGFFGKLFGG